MLVTSNLPDHYPFCRNINRKSFLQEMSENVPYQSTMVLGRTYDLRNNKSGRDIFPETCLSNQQTTEISRLTVKYRVINSSSDVKSLLDVSGDISLKVKAGILKVQGFGSYLSENRSEENMLEIMAVAHAETVSTTLMNPHPYDNWKTNPQGTHYIRSIFYGGDLIIRIRIVASNSKHLEEIKAKVDSKLHVYGTIDAAAKANFKNIEQDLKESSTINFSYYSNAPCTEIPKDVESMMKALGDFQNQLKTVNQGKGSPLRCELVPLSHLDPDFPTISRHTGLEIQLAEFEEIYDDILLAKNMLRTKLAAVTHMTQEEREIGDELEKRIDDMKSRFNEVISALDVTTTGDPIRQAVDYYRKNKKFGGFRAEVKMFFKDDLPHRSIVAQKEATTSQQHMEITKKLIEIPLKWQDIVFYSQLVRPLEILIENASVHALEFDSEYFNTGGRFESTFGKKINPGSNWLTLIANTIISICTGVSGGLKYRMPEKNLNMYLGFTNPFCGSYKSFARLTHEEHAAEWGYENAHDGLYEASPSVEGCRVTAEITDATYCPSKRIVFRIEMGMASQK